MVQLSDELVRQLDVEAQRQGTSRSDLIRQAVAAFLADARRDEVGERIAEGYRRIPPGTPDAWGDLERQAERNQRALAQRLDAEEKAAGVEGW